MTPFARGEKQEHRQTDRQTDRHRQSQTDIKCSVHENLIMFLALRTILCTSTANIVFVEFGTKLPLCIETKTNNNRDVKSSNKNSLALLMKNKGQLWLHHYLFAWARTPLPQHCFPCKSNHGLASTTLLSQQTI